MPVKPEQKKWMRIVITAQCAGVLTNMMFNNGFLLSYFSYLGIASSSILFYLALPSLVKFFLLVPFAYYADRLGKKRLGVPGLLASVIGFGLLLLPSFVPEGLVPLMAVIAISFYAAGVALFGSGWFAILQPIVPRDMRGRFFGRMRIGWQSTGLIAGFIISWALSRYMGISVYRIILGVVTCAAVIRFLLYWRSIPELEKDRTKGKGFIETLMTVLRTPGYLPFCIYVFQLALYTGACGWIFGLLQKDVLHFHASQVVWLANLLFVGAVAGFYAGGKLVDRLGTKPVFLICHISFAVILFLFLLRGMVPLPVIYPIAVLSFLFGFVSASSSIASTTELLGIIPSHNKSMATAINMTMAFGGMSLSAIIAGKVISLGILSDSWQLFGNTMSSYDAILLALAVMITITVMSLGLIPSVIRKAEWSPRLGGRI